MPYQWPQGNIHTQLPVQLVGSDGTPVDLTGVPFANITIQKAIVLSSGPQTYSFAACAGSVTAFTNVTSGMFTYKFAAADVASPGNYKLIIVVDYGSGDLLKTLPFDFTIVKTT